MKAIILAAGRGKRMKNLTSLNPKCLVKFKSKPLIEWQLDALKTSGIKDIALVTGYKRETLQKYNLKEFFNPKWETTEMFYSLTYASKWLEEEECIVSYSDIFYYYSGIKKLINLKSDLAICYDPNWLKIWAKRFEDPLEDAEAFRLNSEGNLLEIGNKAKSVNEIMGQYVGLLKFSPKGWKIFIEKISRLDPTSVEKIHMTNLINMCIPNFKEGIKAVNFSEIWGEIDSPNDLKVYEEIYK